MINEILAVLLFTGVLYLNVNTDYNKWLKNIPIKHARNWFLRGLELIPCIILLNYPWFDLRQIVSSIFLSGAIWWEFFDGWYNKKRGFKWRFNGSKDKDDAFLDKILRKFTPKQQAILKWSLIILFLILYIIW